MPFHTESGDQNPTLHELVDRTQICNKFFFGKSHEILSKAIFAMNPTGIPLSNVNLDLKVKYTEYYVASPQHPCSATPTVH